MEPSKNNVEEETAEKDSGEQVEEEYKTWKKNCHFMYQRVSETILDWPSLTIEFLAQKESPANNDVISENLILGTHTDEAQNYLLYSSVQFSTKGKVNSQVQILKKYIHEGEVNRARAMPQDNSIVATASNTGTVYLYKIDDTLQESVGTFYEKLNHHTENGYGLSWNRFSKGILLTGSDDTTVAIWDINHASAPKTVVKDSEDIVNDVAWQNVNNEHLFGVASEDKNFYFYDLRSGTSPSLKHDIHENPINSLVFSPKSQYLFATGSSDKTIVLSDLRYIKKRLHTLIGHSEAVTSLHWSPFDDRVLASSGGDRRAILWDMSKIGEEQSQEDAEDGAPELLFMHGGHTSGINDFAWSPNYEWMLASVSDDNIVQVWQPTLGVVGRAAHEVSNSDLE